MAKSRRFGLSSTSKQGPAGALPTRPAAWPLRERRPPSRTRATAIHKSQAATYHDGAHCRLDSTVTQEGQAYVALSRCPTRAHCTLERFNPSCLKWNANAEWALTQLRAQQADNRLTALAAASLGRPDNSTSSVSRSSASRSGGGKATKARKTARRGRGAALTAARRLPTRRPASKPIDASALPRLPNPRPKPSPKARPGPKPKPDRRPRT